MRFAACALFYAVPLISATIEGKVTNGVTGAGISGATVRFMDRTSHVFWTTTDASGAYRLTGLSAGEYHGEFSKEGFSDYRQGSSLGDVLGGTNSVRISGDVPAHVDVRLQPWGGLRGRVLDEEGKPAPKVVVEISRNLDNRATTDQNGEFAFQELPPGSYTVVAKPEPRSYLHDNERVGTVPIYYPSVAQLADALPVKVGWGTDVAGIEIRLKSVAVHRVTGVVLDEAGKPVARSTVRLLGLPPATRQALLGGGVSAPGPRFRGNSLTSGFHGTLGLAPEPEVATIESRADGTFEFPAVLQGDWRLTAELYPDGEKPRFGVGPALVGDKDVEGVQIRLSGPFRVPVTANWGSVQPPGAQDGGPTPTAYLLHLIPLEGQPQLQFDPAGEVTSLNNVFPGRYRVVANYSPGGIYAGGATFGGADMLGQVVDVFPHAGPLQLMVRNDTGSLQGTVEHGNGATVFLISKAMTGEILDYLWVNCKAGGAFEFQGIVPGDYYLVAFDHAWQFAAPPPDVPGSIIPIATSIRIDAGSAALPVTVKLNAWSW
jgi:hypothetical protein